MSFSTVVSAATEGLAVEFVHVEADVSNGLPVFHMVGYLASEVKEAGERVRTAIKNSGFDFPAKRTVINLSPATMRKRGASFDLPIAVAVLTALGELSGSRIQNTLIIGEMGLDGSVRKVPGILPIVAEAKEREVRDYLIDRVLNEIPYCRLNGHRTDRLPNNANFSFQFVEGESLLLKLDMKGICASSGSACTSGSLDPSHVLLAIGLPHEIAHGSLRLTLNEEIENEDIDYVVDNLKEIVAHLREMSPLYEDFIKKQK